MRHVRLYSLTKFGDDHMVLGEKITEKCFCPKMPFERPVVDWDMDGP
jgi:hypothetical protein